MDAQRTPAEWHDWTRQQSEGEGAELFGVRVLPESYTANELMLYAPSAFFILGLIVWGVRSWRPGQVAQPRRAADPSSVREIA